MRNRITASVPILVRGAALFLAAYTFIGLIGGLRGRTTDVSLWWVDLRDVAPSVRSGLLVGFAVLAGWWALRPGQGRWLGAATAVITSVFAVFALRDVVGFYAAISAGGVRPFVPIPLSLPIALILAVIARLAARMPPAAAAPAARRVAVWVVSAAGIWAILFPLAQMLFFGTTDYRRPADAAVVFGARVYADGRPSQLLADRVLTGVQLYRSGMVPLLVMSGGNGADGFNEALVMRDVAVASGVPAADVLVDTAGNSTEATVANVTGLLEARGDRMSDLRLIAVSQAYHLPRVQLAFGNAGLDVLTVPAPDYPPISEMPLLVAREVPAFWSYYLRVCLG